MRNRNMKEDKSESRTYTRIIFTIVKMQDDLTYTWILLPMISIGIESISGVTEETGVTNPGTLAVSSASLANSFRSKPYGRNKGAVMKIIVVLWNW